MQKALSESNTFYRYLDLTSYLAKNDIHPGYLDAFLDEEKAQGISSVTSCEAVRGRRIDWLGFSLSITAFLVSSIVTILYLITPAQRLQITTPIAQVPVDTRFEFSRIDERIGRLARAITIIASSSDQGGSPSISVMNLPKTAESPNLVQVAVPKANLRIRPDRKSSAIMAISEGTTLLVNDRVDEWIQVFAPSGELLWIAKALTAEVQRFEHN